MSKISTKNLNELREMAQDLGIDPNGLRKGQLVEAIETKAHNVISVPEREASTDPNIVSDSAGVIGSDLEYNAPGPEVDPSVGKVAVYSARSLNWTGLGKLKLGYNFLTKEEADKWLVHRLVREATPEEVAEHFGVN
jgi:hypothetical protein